MSSESDLAKRRVTWSDRLRSAFLKPIEDAPASTSKGSDGQRSVEELARAARSADDKERLIGLLAAPAAAAIGLLVIGALIANDPPALLKTGHINRLHVNPSIYYDLTGVLLGLSILMLAMAMFRKRLYLGIVMALYGLTIFNLHYWGFGVPFLMAGSWLLVRSYRLQRDLREATAGDGSTQSTRVSRGLKSSASSPRASKRYTPPTPRRRRPSSARSEQRAG
jgi:hypothetical protein